MNAPAIKVGHVSKTFKLPLEKQNSIKGLIINLAHRGARKRSFEYQNVLKDVSFEINPGEFLGIVGRNGSGKSTLLKMLAGIYSPTKGHIEINGKLTPFIELGVGFNPELTGRENVFLNGALLGFSRPEMQAMYDDIVEFAELEKFMDQKLKNYSSGMQVRLAFSIAIRAKSDILLIDEVLAVGDAAFQQKCYEIFANLKAAGRTMVLVTHDMSAVVRFCDRAILIKDGRIQESGSPKDVADAYLELNYEEAKNDTTNETSSGPSLQFGKVTINNKTTGHATLETGSKCKIALEYINSDSKDIQFGIQIFNEAGTYCFGTNSFIDNEKATSQKSGAVQLHLTLDLVPGNYTVTAAIMNSNATKALVYKPKVAAFRINQTSDIEGVASLQHTWDVA